MVSAEGNENSEKNNNRSNQQKSNFARAAHFFCTFLCRCFSRLQRETSRNFMVTRFMEEMSCVFLFTVAHFHPGVLQNFYVVPPTKNVSLFVFFFLTRLALFLVELRWPVALLSLFLCLSLFSKFVDMTINLHLILQGPVII